MCLKDFSDRLRVEFIIFILHFIEHKQNWSKRMNNSSMKTHALMQLSTVETECGKNKKRTSIAFLHQMEWW